jgi:hypothetical protein
VFSVENFIPFVGQMDSWLLHATYLLALSSKGRNKMGEEFLYENILDKKREDFSVFFCEVMQSTSLDDL